MRRTPLMLVQIQPRIVPPDCVAARALLLEVQSAAGSALSAPSGEFENFPVSHSG